MTEEPSHLAREAKSLQQTLKESLKTKDPWDKETDFTRKQLRRNCLRLLLLHPYAPESKDAENHLWMQTSYGFISVYKQRLAVLDRAIHNPRQQHQQQQQQPGQALAQGQGQQHGRGHGGHGVVEHRKLLQRFRQFLADEEKFWIQLIVRIRRIFQLDDVQNILAELGIVPDEPPAENGPPKRNHFQFPSDAEIAAVAPTLTPSTREQRESRMAILSKALVCLGDIERYKEQYNEAGGRPRAGHEDGPPAASAAGNQKGGRGKKGGAQGNGAQGPVMPRMRNYDKAQQCYQQARLLLPQDGNPAHQMAILASYQKDVFGSLAHYYRALCVRSPYDTAADNLGTVLSKTLEQWKARGAKREKERDKEQARGDTAPMAPRLRVEVFKEKLIVLHALWRVPPDEADAISPHLSQKLAEEFKALVTERILPIDIILKTVVLAQGALWKHRMFRTSTMNGHKKAPSPASAAAVESSITGHLLLMHRVLLEVGIVQIAEAPPEDANEHDLAQRITAAFRRTLPALRIASKWLRANLRYVHQASQAGVIGETETKTKGRDRRRGHERRSSSTSLMFSLPGLPDFWRAYAHFSTALWRAFPADKLPQLVTLLEEDVEMAGFLPLKRFVPADVVGVATPTRDVKAVPASPNGTVTAPMQGLLPEQVHPNEEQLMRIADLLADADAFAKDDLAPITFLNGTFTTHELPELEHAIPARAEPPRKLVRDRPAQSMASRMSPALPPRIPHEAPSTKTDHQDMIDTRNDDDDPVGDAFREALDRSEAPEDDEDDRIVWPLAPGPPSKVHDPVVAPPNPQVALPVPIAGPIVPLLPASPPRPFVANPAAPTVRPRSPETFSPGLMSKVEGDARSPVAPLASVTTAQDILANVLRSAPLKTDFARSLHTRQLSVPQTHMLFGSSALGGGPSIWSSNQSSGLPFQGAAGTTKGPSYQTPYNQSHITNPTSVAFSTTQTPLGLGPSIAPHYNPPPLSGTPGHQPFSGGLGHQRVQSMSFLGSPSPPSSQSQTQRTDLLSSHPGLVEQMSLSYNSGVPDAFADPVYSRKLDMSYVRQEAPGVHDRSVPYHYDPRKIDYDSPFPPHLSSMAQLWNNAG